MSELPTDPFRNKEIRETKDFSGMLTNTTLNVEKSVEDLNLPFRGGVKPRDIHFVRISLGDTSYDAIMTQVQWQMLRYKKTDKPKDIEVGFKAEIAERMDILPTGYKQVYFVFDAPDGEDEGFVLMLSEVDRKDLKSKLEKSTMGNKE